MLCLAFFICLKRCSDVLVLVFRCTVLTVASGGHLRYVYELQLVLVVAEVAKLLAHMCFHAVTFLFDLIV